MIKNNTKVTDSGGGNYFLVTEWESKRGGEVREGGKFLTSFQH